MQKRNLESPVDRNAVLKFSEERQEKIWKALMALDEKLGKYIASIYEGILLSLQGNNPEKIPIVCHLVRELSAILPRYLPNIPIQKNSLSDHQIKEKLFYIKKIIDTREQKQDDIKALHETIDNLIAHFENSSQKEKLRGVIVTHPTLGIRPEYMNDEFIKQWTAVHNYFVTNSHYPELKNKKTKTFSESEFKSNLNTFEGLIYRVLVEEPFFGAIQDLDRVLELQDPNEKDADELMRLVVEFEHRRYFFNKCENPKWLELLNKRGAFSSPQKPIKNGNYIQFMVWPESQYLAKIAKQKPQEVFDIINNLDSDNESILIDFINAALVSPSDIASGYVKLIKKKKWLRSVFNSLLPDKASDLMEKLASEGKKTEAISLANEIFELHIIDPVQTSDNPNATLPWTHPDAKPYFDEWEYGEIIQNKTKSLAANSPIELFDVYANKLRNAIRLEEKENPENGEIDYSYIWRPNISHSSHNRADAKNILIDGLISLSELYKDNDSILITFIQNLHKHSLILFKRIEMFILNMRSDIFMNEAEIILKNEKYLYAYSLRKEYIPLLGSMFEKMSTDVQNEIISMIASGPRIKEREDLPQEERERICENWKNLFYAVIEKHLPESHNKLYKNSIGKYGKPEDNDGVITSSWVSENSPVSKDELAALSPVDVLEYLRLYEAPKDMFSRYSTNSLGKVFADVVTEYPEEYSKTSSLLLEKKIRPLYIYHFFNGLKEAIKKNTDIKWHDIIDLCRHLINLDISNLAEPASQYEQDWSSVKHAMSGFLSDSLGNRNCKIPLELREGIWEVLVHLVEEKDPTPADETNNIKGNLDPVTISINTIRGEAMHAVINYGLWLARNQKNKVVERMPSEIQRILDLHLDISKDCSLAIRSVYGWRLPNLFYLNKKWITSKIDVIFPQQDELKSFLIAALEGYFMNHVYYDVFDSLKKVYWNAIELLGNEQEKRGYRVADIEERLPQHLMIVYLHNSKHDDLIEHFFQTAPAKSRGQAINFIGRNIFPELSTYPDKETVGYRIKKLWDQRISPSGTVDIEELQEFGWWIRQSPLNHEDTIDRLLKTLEITKGVIDITHEIIEKLLNYVAEYPLQSIIVLDLIARADRKYHEYYYKKESYKAIIQQVKLSGIQEAIQKANNLINFLGSKGLIEFRELL